MRFCAGTKRLQNGASFFSETAYFFPLSFPLTAFSEFYGILRASLESLENTTLFRRAFTPFYTPSLIPVHPPPEGLVHRLHCARPRREWASHLRSSCRCRALKHLVGDASYRACDVRLRRFCHAPRYPRAASKLTLALLEICDKLGCILSTDNVTGGEVFLC